ncbi:DUF4390 domain-containing protein [Uliginosibacterium sediminicola]|uniref:DUF4390 domain-containing protein n=1 Tax=Uliginosibacterium sediminicola TaxID=2024550 RepID=A0ABU9YTW3_9RHOO
MMVSILPCYKSAPLLERLAAWLGCLLLCLLPLTLQAETRHLDVQFAELVPLDNRYVVNASLTGEPPARIEELVQGGVVMPFIVEFSLHKPRWYWFNEVITEQTLDIRLAYHALTRQYRLNVGGVTHSFASFEQAFSALRSLRNWPVLERGQLRPGESYEAALRLRLDTAQLPKPFQVASLSGRDLNLSTGWTRWTFINPLK